jgi:hypothetical protein
MSSVDRAFKRNRDKKLFKQVYGAKRKKEGEAKKARAAKERMKNHWKEVAEKVIPLKQRAIGARIPPKWYLKFWRAIILNLPSEKFSYAVIENKAIPHWVKSVIMFCCTFTAWVLSALFVNWLLSIRRHVMTWGLKTRVLAIAADTSRLTIWYKGKIVDESEWKS